MTLVQKLPQLQKAMFNCCRFIESRRSTRNAYTLIELLAVMFVFLAAGVAFETVRKNHGQGLSLLAGILAVLGVISLYFLFLRWAWRRDKQNLTRLREQYRTIYQVKELPTDPKSIIKLAAAEIQIGDYGWDAKPSRKDGLIHLQGLTSKWQVVWHAAFRPDQIVKVADKPKSQYDYWVPYWAKPPPPPPCPYPVRERETPTFGLPHHSGRYFEHHTTQLHRDYYSPNKEGG